MTNIKLIFEQITAIKLIPSLKSTVHMMRNTVATVYISLIGIPDVGGALFNYITLDGVQMVTLSGEEMVYI